MTTPTDLIARLEAASGASSRLDMAIAQMLGLVKISRGSFKNGDPVTGCYYKDDEGKWQMYVQYNKHVDDEDVDFPRSLEPYTSSIDAALSLVPSNYTAHVCFSKPADAILFRHANDGTDLHDAIKQDVKAEAATAPLAIVIAALRARSHKEP